MIPESLQLRVDWLKLGGAPLVHSPGRLGLSSCPGRPDTGGGLAADVALLAELRVRAVLSLVDALEMARYGVCGLAEALRAADIAHLSFPIVDGLPPLSVVETRSLCRKVLSLLGEGEGVLVHCIGGWGRTGTLAAALLLHEGHSPRRAIELVRRARSPRCIESMAQEVFVNKYAHYQRGFQRHYLLVPRAELPRLLLGERGDRRCQEIGMLRQAKTAEHLLRLVMQVNHVRAAAEVVVLSGEAKVGDAPAELPVDRAFQIDGPGLLPVPFDALHLG